MEGWPGELLAELRLVGKSQGMQIYHINLLKPWKVCKASLVSTHSLGDDQGSTDPFPDLITGLMLGESPTQQAEIQSLLEKCEEMFTVTPG